MLECVNQARRLWRWTHRTMIRTDEAELRKGGLLSLSVSMGIQVVMAGEMARGDQ